jgi:hypothetical protein
MDTTVVAATAIGAMAGLIGGLGGPVITARIQRSNERSRQRERAEVLGSAGLLLTELNPGSVLVPIYVAPVLQSSEQDAIGEALAKLAKLDQRVPVVRENLSTLAGWWSTATGSDLAEQLQAAIFELRRLDGLLIEDLHVHDVTPDLRDRAFEVWKDANSLASQLRAEIRGDAGPPPPKLLPPPPPKLLPPPPPKLLLPARPESWTGSAPTGWEWLQRWLRRR